MGNAGSEPIDNAIRLTDEAEAKLKNFVNTNHGESSLTFVIFEGNVITAKITRFVFRYLSYFSICWSFIDGNGGLISQQTDYLKMNDCLCWLKDHIANDGAKASEDPDQKAFVIFSSFDSKENELSINWRMLEEESFVAPLPDSVTKLRSVMKRELNLEE